MLLHQWPRRWSEGARRRDGRKELNCQRDAYSWLCGEWISSARAAVRLGPGASHRSRWRHVSRRRQPWRLWRLGICARCEFRCTCVQRFSARDAPASASATWRPGISRDSGVGRPLGDMPALRSWSGRTGCVCPQSGRAVGVVAALASGSRPWPRRVAQGVRELWRLSDTQPHMTPAPPTESIVIGWAIPCVVLPGPLRCSTAGRPWPRLRKGSKGRS